MKQKLYQTLCKKLAGIIVSFLFFISCAAQQINYGNNAVAGNYYSVRGIKLYAEVYGKGTPLLLMHGNGGSIAAFNKTIPYFSKYYKVIAVDSRAHGKSIDHGDSLSFNMIADDMAALLDLMRIDSAYLIGWSDGGIVALVMAMRHPSKVKKFASTGANIKPDSTALIPAVYHQMQNGYKQYKDSTFTDPIRKNDWKIFTLDVFQPMIEPEQLASIKCPALIIAGDRDVIVAEHTLSLFRHIPGSHLWIVPDSGHATLIEHATEFNEQVDKFFKGLKK